MLLGTPTTLPFWVQVALVAFCVVAASLIAGDVGFRELFFVGIVFLPGSE